MTHSEYKSQRQKRGTQKEVAALLGVDYMTVQRRELGKQAIGKEAKLALMALPIPRKRHKSNA
jgi:transcriptional regulator with XRE-family HTH domain